MLSYFILVAPAAPSPLALAYKWSVPGYYGALLAVLAVLTLPLALSAWTRWLLPLLAWCWLLFLAIDIATFNLYQFHVNWVLVEMFVEDFRGLGIPLPLLAGFVGLALLLALAVV
ncbi:MAG TPA: hypothetical protein VFH22_10275, partial [Rhodocyclaceae bacterium]|nr:hypothetical protein [Rhodocyclaceae bacterium]